MAGAGPGGAGSPDPGRAGVPHRCGTGAEGDVRVRWVRAGPAGPGADRRRLPRPAEGAAAAPPAARARRAAGGDRRSVPRRPLRERLTTPGPGAGLWPDRADAIALG